MAGPFAGGLSLGGPGGERGWAPTAPPGAPALPAPAAAAAGVEGAARALGAAAAGRPREPPRPRAGTGPWKSGWSSNTRNPAVLSLLPFAEMNMFSYVPKHLNKWRVSPLFGGLIIFSLLCGVLVSIFGRELSLAHGIPDQLSQGGRG